MTPIAELVQSNAVSWLFIPSAILLGALHALEPGHSKTMMAAFIVAIRGTIPQAALLAVTATISHTAVVWIVAILALTYGSQYSAEASEPYFQLISAAIILGVAIWMLVRTYRDQQAAKMAAAYTHGPALSAETKLIDTGRGVAELSIFEDGVPPRFRLRLKDFRTRDGTSQPPPAAEKLTVETIRDDGTRQTFQFKPQGDFVESTATIPEPHQFSAVLSIAHTNHTHTYETRFVEHDHEHDHKQDHGHDHGHGHSPTTPPGTTLIDTKHGVLLSLCKDGSQARFQLHFKDKAGHPTPPPPGETFAVETTHADGVRETFELKPHGDLLEAVSTIRQPHQFAVSLTTTHRGHTHKHEAQFPASDHNHDHTHERGHEHGHHHQPDHGHDHAHDEEHDRSHGDKHSHAGLDASDPGFLDAHARAHAREIQRRFAKNQNVTTGQIAWFGLTGGLLPCPAAIIVLMLCLQLQNFWLGMVLVLCFSIGLALTLLASGVVASWGVRHASRRWPGFDTFMRRAPYFSSAVIIFIGLYVGYQGVTALA